MLWNPIYEQEGNEIVQTYTLATGNVLRYSARDVRKEATGIHAVVKIAVNYTSLAWSTFNVERDEDRVRLSNSAFTAWGKEYALDQEEFPKTFMKKALDFFCEGIWTEVVRQDRGELMEGDPDLPPATLLLGNFIVEGGGAIIFAPPGRGKSYTAMLQAVSLDAGKEKLWTLPNGPRRCGYINLERSRESMSRRLAAVNRTLGLDPRRALPFINARGRTLRDILPAAIDTFQEYNVEVVFLDSISRMGYGDLTADKSSNAAMDDLNRHFSTWVALGHTPRATDTHVIGSQMFDAAADITIRLITQTSRDEAATGVGLTVDKANDTPKGHMAIHVLEWSPTGLAGVRKARPSEFSEIEAGKKPNLEEEVAELLGMVGAQSATAIAKTLQRNRPNVSSLLKASPLFRVTGKNGAEVLYGLQDNRLGNTYVPD